jgi:hypothetical protein
MMLSSRRRPLRKVDITSLSPNKSLQRAGDQWYLVCKPPVVIDKLPMIGVDDPPGAELSR